jgi:hypothetical protein
MGWYGLDLSGSGQGPVIGYFEHSNLKLSYYLCINLSVYFVEVFKQIFVGIACLPLLAHSILADYFSVTLFGDLYIYLYYAIVFTLLSFLLRLIKVFYSSYDHCILLFQLSN